MTRQYTRVGHALPSNGVMKKSETNELQIRSLLVSHRTFHNRWRRSLLSGGTCMVLVARLLDTLLQVTGIDYYKQGFPR